MASSIVGRYHLNRRPTSLWGGGRLLGGHAAAEPPRRRMMFLDRVQRADFQFLKPDLVSSAGTDIQIVAKEVL